jgi:hypothetical protein
MSTQKKLHLADHLPRWTRCAANRHGEYRILRFLRTTVGDEPDERQGIEEFKTTASSPLFRLTSDPSFLRLLWFGLLTLLGGIWAYYRVFSGFSFWDDEGTTMASVKQYLDGLKLYDQFWSGYGPAYYFYNLLLRSGTGTPVTHDVVRISALLPWLVTALVCAWIILRITDSLVLATLAHLLTLYSLQFFAVEPGHPQELCILLLVCFVASGIWIGQKRHFPATILLGVLPVALLLMKVNLGIFAILAIGLSLSFHAKENWLSKTFRASFVGASLFLPFALMRHQLADPQALVYCVILTCSIGAFSLILFCSNRTISITSRDSGIVVISFILTFATIVLLSIAKGSSLQSMVDRLVLLHLKVSVGGLFYSPVSLSAKWRYWSFIGIAAAGWAALSMKDKGNRSLKYLFPIKLLFGLGVIATLFATNGCHLLAFATPFSWLLLYPLPEKCDSRLVFWRTLLCTTAVIQTLCAYPVAGSQALFIRILLIVVGVICIDDFWLWFAAKYDLGGWHPSLLRGAGSVALFCLVLDYAYIAYAQRESYNSLTALNLAGASRIHLNQRQAREYQWLTRNSISYCDILIGLPNIPSLNFWAGMNPPVRLNADAWMLVLSDQEQFEIERELSKHPKACAIYNPEILRFWNRNGRDLSGLPLVRYIHDEFKPVGSIDNFVFLVRKERDLSKIPNG